MGHKENNIDPEGYDSFDVVLSSSDGEVKINRKIGEGRATISSFNLRVESGIFGIKKRSGVHQKDKFLDDWLLIMMGVESKLNIVVSSDWKKQDFTFKTYLNSFIVKQEDIIRRESPYLPPTLMPKGIANPDFFFFGRVIDSSMTATMSGRLFGGRKEAPSRYTSRSRSIRSRRGKKNS